MSLDRSAGSRSSGPRRPGLREGSRRPARWSGSHRCRGLFCCPTCTVPSITANTAGGSSRLTRNRRILNRRHDIAARVDGIQILRRRPQLKIRKPMHQRLRLVLKTPFGCKPDRLSRDRTLFGVQGEPRCRLQIPPPACAIRASQQLHPGEQRQIELRRNGAGVVGWADRDSALHVRQPGSTALRKSQRGRRSLVREKPGKKEGRTKSYDWSSIYGRSSYCLRETRNVKVQARLAWAHQTQRPCLCNPPHSGSTLYCLLFNCTRGAPCKGEQRQKRVARKFSITRWHFRLGLSQATCLARFLARVIISGSPAIARSDESIVPTPRARPDVISWAKVEMASSRPRRSYRRRKSRCRPWSIISANPSKISVSACTLLFSE